MQNFLELYNPAIRGNKNEEQLHSGWQRQRAVEVALELIQADLCHNDADGKNPLGNHLKNLDKYATLIQRALETHERES